MIRGRIESIDIAKGLLISLVVVGHILNTEYPIASYIKSFIYVFHVPAFFVITGILTDVQKVLLEKPTRFIWRKFKSLIFPYILLEILAATMQMIVLGREYLNVTGAVSNILLIYCNAGATWFLPTLFMANVLEYVYLKLRNECKVLSHIVLLLSCIIPFCVPKTHLFIVLSRSILGFLFIVAGTDVVRKIYKHFEKDGSQKKWIIALSVCIVAIIAAWNGKVGMNLCEYNNPFLYLIGAISGSVFIILVSQLMHCTFLRLLGKYSLVIMGTHLNYIVLFEKYFDFETLPLHLWVPMLLIVVIMEFITIYIWNFVSRKKLIDIYLPFKK